MESQSDRATKRPRMDASSDSSASSSEGDMLSEVSEENIQKLMEFEKQLKAQPIVYDTHVGYITLLRQTGLKEKLKNARMEFHKSFPLSETLWSEWIQDEMDPSTQESLLKLAVEDYLSVALWKRLLAVVFEKTAKLETASLDAWRDVAQEGLDRCGMHFSEGHEIWKQVIDAEKVLLGCLPEAEIEDQVERIRQHYFDAFQCPLLHIDTLLEGYQQWETERGSMTTEPPPQIQSLMESARRAIEIRKKFEEALAVEDVTQKLAAFVSHCTMEERHGTVAQVECIYERALAAFPSTHSLWLQYGSYLEKKTKLYDKIEKLYGRAVRNCPWLGSLWEKRIRAGALYEKAQSQIQPIYEQALQAGLQTEEDYLTVILAWLDFLRCDYWKRRTGGDQAASFEPMQQAFAFAVSLMKSFFPKYFDRSHRLVRYWADSVISINQDIEQARAIWEDALQDTKAAASYDTWALYIRMEVGEKHHGPARKLYSRAFNAISSQAHKYALVVDWLRHEGTSLLMRQVLDTVGSVGTTGTPRQYANAFNATQSFVQEYLAALSARQNPALGAESKKKAKNTAKMSEEDVTELRRHRAKETQTQQALQDASSAPQWESDKPKKLYDDKNTLFVSRIPLGTEDDQLRAIFEGCGEVTALRHMRFPNGATRGRAYVVFSDDAGMREGLKKNGTEINGKGVLVQISCPTRLHPGVPHPGFSRGRGRGRGGRGRGRGPPTEGPLTNEDFRKMLQ